MDTGMRSWLGTFRWAVVPTLLIAMSLAFAAPRTRSVTGVVTDKRGNALKGAAVQLENSATLSIVSYLTRDDGRYYFHQLSPDIDFKLTAKYKRWFSKSKLLNKFDTRETAEINLEVPVE